MKLQNIDKAIELAKELKDLEMCRDLIYGGSKISVTNYHGEHYNLPTDILLRKKIISGIKERIESVNKELEEL